MQRVHRPPLIPAQAGIQGQELGPRFRGDERRWLGSEGIGIVQQQDRNWSRRTLLGAALGAPFAFSAAAQTYPSRNLRLIVPFPAGGPTDVLARIAAERANPGLGQPLIVENRAGAGGNIAGEMAARAEASGRAGSDVQSTIEP